MFWLNKSVWFILNPAMLPLLAGVAGLLVSWRGKGRLRRFGAWLAVCSLAFLWFFATPACVCLLGLPLERPYLATQRPDALPAADAIVILGGGIGKCDGLEYPDMADGADRVWHAARLYKEGKAQKIVVSGSNDLAAAVPLLVDLGVPREAVLVDNESRNTYENSRFTERLLKAAGNESPKVLLVTSAWHMPRALGNFSRTSLTVTPAATDFKAHTVWLSKRMFVNWVLPYPEGLFVSSELAKEWLGRFARK